LVIELENGVWDLPLDDGGRVDVERRYQALTGGPEVTTVVLDGVLVANTNGGLYEIQSHFGDNPHFNKELKKPYDHPDNFHPAGGLPPDSVFVVRTKVLAEFEKLIREDSQAVDAADKSQDKPLSTVERKTLLTIIAALCHYSAIRHQERGTAKQIEKLTVDIGTHVTDETILKFLKQIPNALETRMK